MTKNAVLVSRRALEALPADQQAAVRTAAARAETRGYELAEAATRETEATLAARGMQVGAAVAAVARRPHRAWAAPWPMNG